MHVLVAFQKPFFHPATGEPVIAYENVGVPERICLDHTLVADFQFLDQVISHRDRGILRITSASMDLSIWILKTISDVKPPEYWLYDRKRRTVGYRYLFPEHEKLMKYDFVKMNGISVTTRDGKLMVNHKTYRVFSDRPWAVIWFSHFWFNHFKSG